MWADDLLLFSENEGGLNTMLDKLFLYLNENRLEVNVNKTKCMIFNKTGRHIRRTFLFGNSKINTIREYQYLGVLITTPSLNLSVILVNLKDEASKAYFLLKNRMGEHFRGDI